MIVEYVRVEMIIWIVLEFVLVITKIKIVQEIGVEMQL